MLRLNASTVQALIREAAAQPDREVCGLVWANEGLRAQTVCPLPNVHHEPGKYFRTAPADVRRAFMLMDDEGGTPLAWYHSHPGGKPDPSEEDMRGAMQPGMHYLIVYPETEAVPSTPAPVGFITKWRITAWECPEMGLLLSTEWKVSV